MLLVLNHLGVLLNVRLLHPVRPPPPRQPVPQLPKVPAGVRDVALDVVALDVIRPHGGDERHVARAHEELPDVVDAMFC